MKNFCKNCGVEIKEDGEFFMHVKKTYRRYHSIYCTDDPEDINKAVPKPKEDYITKAINEFQQGNELK